MRHVAAPALLLLGLPLALAASSSGTDDAGDVILSTWIGVASLDVAAADLGCSADAVDLGSLDVTSDATHVTMRLAPAALGAEATCRGQVVPSSYANYHVDLEGARYGVWTLGGDYCDGGAWDCVLLVERGPGGFVDDLPAATGGIEDGAWVLRVPLAGTTFGGRAYDLRGEGFLPEADAQQDVEGASAQWHDEAGAPWIVL